MATATLDKVTEQQTDQVQQTIQLSTLPGCSLADIATDVEQPVEAVRDWAAQNGISVIPYKGEEIVAGEMAIAAYDYFEPLLLQQRKAKRLGLTSVTPAYEQNRNPGVSDEAPVMETATSGTESTATESRKQQPSIKLKSYKIAKNNYTTTADRYLNAVAPDDEAAQLSVAQDIVNQTELGQQHFEKALGGYDKATRESVRPKLLQGFQKWLKANQAESAEPQTEDIPA